MPAASLPDSTGASRASGSRRPDSSACFDRFPVASGPVCRQDRVGSVREQHMARADFLHPDFVAEPYWWEAYRPTSGELAEMPREARVAIVGAGYAGLAT